MNPDLAFLAPWREHSPKRVTKGQRLSVEFAQAAKIFKHSNAQRTKQEKFNRKCKGRKKM